MLPSLESKEEQIRRATSSHLEIEINSKAKGSAQALKSTNIMWCLFLALWIKKNHFFHLKE